MGRHLCCNQQKVKRGLWSPDEDEKLINYITKYGYGCWSEVPEKSGLQRCGKSCRLRWINYLRPDIRRGNFSPNEEKLIIHLHTMVGNRYKMINHSTTTNSEYEMEDNKTALTIDSLLIRADSRNPATAETVSEMAEFRKESLCNKTASI